MIGYIMPIQLQASLALLLAQLSFSGWHILGSVSFHDGADPFVFCLYRIILGTTLMHVYVRYYGMNMVIDTVDYVRFLYLGILSFISMILTALCLRYIAPSRFAIFQPSIPCIVAAMSMMSGLEKLSKIKILGLVVAVGGALIAETWKFQANANAELDIPLGTGLAVGQVLAMGSLLVGVKPLLSKYQPAVVSCVYFTVATGATILLCLARFDMFPVEAFTFHGQMMPWIALVYAAVFTTLFAFIALSWGGKYLNPTVSTVYFTFQPLGTIVLSSVILGSVVTLPEVVGGLMIVAGLGITSSAALLFPKEEECSDECGAVEEGEGVCMIRTTSADHLNVPSANGTVNTTMDNAVLSSTNSAHTTINTSTGSATSAESPLNWPSTSIALMKAAYRNHAALLTSTSSSTGTSSTSSTSGRHSGHVYNPLRTDEGDDVERGPSATSPRSTIPTNNNIYAHDSSNSKNSKRSSLSGGIAFSLEPPDEYSHRGQYECILDPSPPPVVRSAHSTKMTVHSPVRQRSVTVDSPSAAASSSGVLKNSTMRRNQSSFNA